MFVYVLIIFIVFPILEISLLLQVGKYIGFFPTLAVILLTAFVGAGLARSQGTAILKKLQAELSSGQLPADTLLEGLLVFAAGLLLLTPGFISDGVGLLCLVPVTRASMRSLLKILLAKKILQAGFHSRFGFSRQKSRDPNEIRSNWKVEP